MEIKQTTHIITSPMTEAQNEYWQHIRERIEAIKHMTPKEREESKDNYLLILLNARESALSPRLINPNATESGGKIEKVAEKVLEIHSARPDVTQMIFLDFGGKPNEWGYSVNDDIQNRLIEGGIAQERIANFSRMSDDARQKATERLNSSEYLIGLGSNWNMGACINARQLLAAIHHVDPPWVGSSLETRNSGHQQGNMNDPTKSEVEVYYYLTEGSLDALIWQALTGNSNFIDAEGMETVDTSFGFNAGETGNVSNLKLLDAIAARKTREGIVAEFREAQVGVRADGERTPDFSASQAADLDRSTAKISASPEENSDVYEITY
jgi:hypothetical protein